MKNKITTFLLPALIAVIMTSPVFSFASRLPARAPEEPRHGDPDLSAIEDARLLQIWGDTVVAYRRENPYVDSIYGNWVDRAKTLSPGTPEDQAYLMDTFEAAITKTPVDWNYVRTVLIVMQAVLETTPRIPELANRMYKMPRPIKMSLAHGSCYKLMIPVLELQQSEEAAALLYNMAHTSYWGDDPMFSPPLSKTSQEESILNLRSLSVGTLAEFPPTIGLPYLERLAATYPPPEDYEDKIRIMTSSNWDNNLYFLMNIQNALQQIKKKEAARQE